MGDLGGGLRKIDIGSRVRQIASGSDRPDLVWVPISTLVVNDAYQRPILGKGWRQIERIAAAFDWAMFGPVVVAPVGNRFALIDGQHRAHAAYLAGHDEIPAMVVEMSAVEQARAFAAMNTAVTRMSAHNVFRAALAAREPWAVEADAAVSDAGCRLMPYANSAASKKPGEIYSVTLIRRHIEAGEGEVVTACLSAIRATDEEGVRDCYEGALLKAFFAAVASNIQFLRRIDLARFCRETDLLAVAIIAAAQAAATRRPKGTILRAMLVEALVDALQCERA